MSFGASTPPVTRFFKDFSIELPTERTISASYTGTGYKKKKVIYCEKLGKPLLDFLENSMFVGRGNAEARLRSGSTLGDTAFDYYSDIDIMIGTLERSVGTEIEFGPGEGVDDLSDFLREPFLLLQQGRTYAIDSYPLYYYDISNIVCSKTDDIYITIWFGIRSDSSATGLEGTAWMKDLILHFSSGPYAAGS